MTSKEDTTGRWMDIFHNFSALLLFLWTLLNWLWNRQRQRRVGPYHQHDFVSRKSCWLNISLTGWEKSNFFLACYDKPRKNSNLLNCQKWYNIFGCNIKFWQPECIFDFFQRVKCRRHERFEKSQKCMRVDKIFILFPKILFKKAVKHVILPWLHQPLFHAVI